MKIIRKILLIILLTFCLTSCMAVTYREKTKGIYIIYTSDVHCGIDQGYGYAGVYQKKLDLETAGYDVILVDNGDAIQGELIGSFTKGKEIVNLMNEVGYDIATPGNHEFDYGMDAFFEAIELAEYDIVSCNFTKNDELVFDSYVIKTIGNIDIAFVGITTPNTLTSSTPKNFQDEDGNYIYGFYEDETGEKLYNQIQKTVDQARGDGADLVYALAHVGETRTDARYDYESIIENTTGIDCFLDGHSHDSEQVTVMNKDGIEVTRSACGTKLSSIGYSLIDAKGEILETNIWVYDNETITENKITTLVNNALNLVNEFSNRVVAYSDYLLTIYDQNKLDASGRPIRMVRDKETNLADLAADSIRIKTNAQIGLINGGGVRSDIVSGEITYGDIIKVMPFGNMIAIVDATGQQILDALEWSYRLVPASNGAFIHVSGIKVIIDSTVSDPCTMDNMGMLSEINGERRVKAVYIGEELLDPNKTYTVASNDYLLLKDGDGNTAFRGCKVIDASFDRDYQVLIDYIVNELNGVIPSYYENIYGNERIIIQ